MSDRENERNPFIEFINAQLDMDGVDGICFETVALAVRDAVRHLPPAEETDQWEQQLDRLQSTLRMSLTVEAIGRLLREHPRLSDLNPFDLDLAVSLSITLSFLTYNDLSTRFDFQPDHAREQSTRLWVALRAASGWVDKAGNDGDLVAKQAAAEIHQLLEDLRPPGWKNHTHTL